MAALTDGTSQQVTPNAGVKFIEVVVEATAADTIDLSSASATGGQTLSTIRGLVVCAADGEVIEDSTFSGTTVTVGTGPSAEDISILAWGN